MKLFRKYYYGDYDSIGNTSSGAGNVENTSTKTPLQKNSEVPNSLPTGATEHSEGWERSSRGGAFWPLWEVFIRSKQGLDHKHVGSLHAADAQMAVENARDVYTRRQEGVSIWVVESRFIHASNPDEAESFYEPAEDKVYRHPTFYDLPDGLTHM
jgi:ring-1,2-phenylacetyl-CoA epoxidase subunit PaaB